MNASVRQENRYRRLVIKTGQSECDRRRLIEAAFMARGPRHPAISPSGSTSASRKQVRSWMRRNAADFDTATELAEAANAALELPASAMDDDTHWIWDEALRAIDAEPEAPRG